MNNRILWGFGALALVIVVGIAGFLLLSSNSSSPTQKGNGESTNKPTTQPSAPQSAQQAALEKTYGDTKTVLLTSSGFNPQTITINTGGRVIWTNQSGATGTVNSDSYPTNLLWPFLNLGSFDDGASVSVTFDKPGTYTYHNHLSPSETGTIIVK